VTVTTLHEPGHREALWELQAAFDRGDVATVVGRCRVSYEGRAASELGPGDRLLLLKPDGAAAVHTAEGREPVNWQPPGCTHRAAVRDGRLCVTSERSAPDERLTVRFDAVDQVTTLRLAGGAGPAVEGTEADLRERVLAEPSLVADGFEPRETERSTAAGDVDVFGVDDAGRPTVVELKRRRVGPDAVGQLGRYVDAVEREAGGEAVRGILVAPSVTDRAADLLTTEGFEHVALSPGCGADGDAGRGPDRSIGSDPGTGTGTDAEPGARPGTDAGGDGDGGDAAAPGG
jgi:RecB family endonuclease NucS